MISRYYFGIIAEGLVAIYYFFSGYYIVSRRMRNYAGEIDLICKKGDLLVFVEVKARRRYDGSFNEWMISEHQKNRIIRAACVFNKDSAMNLRFDVVIFSLNKWFSIIKNAWC